MDGDLRYISLQYIKGDNYEEITCFNYERIMKLLGDTEAVPTAPATPALAPDAAPTADAAPATDTDNVKKQLNESVLKLYFELTDAKEEEKCKIGETFLNDLVNYYNFKDIKRLLIKAKKTTEAFISEDKKNNQDVENHKENKQRLQLLEKIKTVFSTSVKEKIKEKIGSVKNFLTLKPQSNDISDEKKETMKELLPELLVGYSTGDSTGDSISKIKDELKGAKDLNTFKQNKEKLNEALYKDLQHSANDLFEALNETEEDIDDVATKTGIFKVKLNELHKNLNQDINDKQKELNDKKEGFDNLMRLYNTYIKYCKINMEKYEKLFEYNEISNIDEAFMIESYSKFLKKLRKLKENLESKDTGKTKRLLVNSFNKLFNKHGIDPNKTLSDADIEYITNLILQ